MEQFTAAAEWCVNKIVKLPHQLQFALEASQNKLKIVIPCNEFVRGDTSKVRKEREILKKNVRVEERECLWDYFVPGRCGRGAEKAILDESKGEEHKNLNGAERKSIASNGCELIQMSESRIFFAEYSQCQHVV